VAARSCRQNRAAKPGIGDLLIQLADPLVQLANVQAVASQQIPGLLRLGPAGD
jgi:hypothetical protein